jgi:transmembrane sensor
MWDDRLEYLFELYYRKEASDPEKAELLKFLEKPEYQDQVGNLIINLLRSDAKDTLLSKEISDDILTSIFQTTRNQAEENNLTGSFDEPAPERSYLFGNWRYWLAAAALSGIAIFGGYSLITSYRETSVSEKFVEKDLPPGKDRAQLALWDGTLVELGSGVDSRVPLNSGIRINTLEGEIVSDKISTSVGYNTLSTPLGGEYKVVLPDGSKAWLNAGSSIRFPTAFTGGKRIVAMSGEVYFEITPDKQMPFTVQLADKKVNGGNMEVTVLGTHFNISSYADEPSINTTLVEGAVEIKQGNVKKVLLPGEQARVSYHANKPAIHIKTVDTQGVVAWKEGRFEFNGNIQEIMRQLARWYKVQVRYEGNTDQKSFSGAISRKNNISQVLKILELTGEVRFVVDKETVVVKPAHQ